MIGALTVLLGLVAAVPAVAQEMPPLPAPDEPMEPRQATRSGYAPVGLPLGGVMLHGDAGVARVYRSEQHVGGAGVETTALTEVDARLSAKTGGSWWSLQGRAGLEVVRGRRGAVDNQTNADAGLRLRIPLGPAAVGIVEGSYALDHEPRTEPVAEGTAAAPVPVSRLGAAAEVRYRPGRRFSADLRLAATGQDFDDVARLRPESVDPAYRVINNDDRDRLRLTAAGRVAWHFNDLTSVYLRGTASAVDYASGTDDYGFARDNAGTRWALGLTIGRPRQWRAFLEAGHISRSYDDDRLPDLESLAVAAGLTAAMTPLMTGQARLFAEVAETTEPFASGVLIRGGEVEVEHEVLRTLILTSRVRLAVHDYMGPLGRRDLSRVETIGARWRLGRLLRVEAALQREELQAAWAEDSYQAVEAGIRLAGRF